MTATRDPASIFSDDEDELVAALGAIRKDRQAPPSPAVVERIVKLFNHPCVEVQHDAVVAVGIHWGVESTLGPILALLDPRRDEYVLFAVIGALGSLARDSPETKYAAIAGLAPAIRNAAFNDRVRGWAYLELRRITGAIDLTTYAAQPTDAPIAIDLAWLDSELRRWEIPS